MNSLTLIIFGITSNLAQIKLIPALYDMVEKDLLPKNFSVVGVARKPMTQDEFRQYFHQVLHKDNIHHQHPIQDEVFERLSQQLHYVDGHLDDPLFYPKLDKYLKTLPGAKQTATTQSHNKIYYLATYPNLYETVFENLQTNNMSKQDQGWIRLMIEKPIGNDLESAKKLNQLLLKYFSEDQIYRLDHYLGKETIQNILTFRFGNGIFEPLMNGQSVDHIQITAAEDFGIGRRGSYYDTVGALKDVGQNHQLQMLAFATMDPPAEFTNPAVTKQRLRILETLTPIPKKIIFGQYEGYTKEESVRSDSKTDTFYAFKTFIDTPRWKDVPIYIRAGKKMASTVTEIIVVFKNPENRLFKNLDCGMEPNTLVYRIQPNEGIVLKILTKKPGHQVVLEEQFMQFCYRQNPHYHDIPDPYERLIVDAIKGDQTFFNDAEEVEAQWAFVDPLVVNTKQPVIYQPGSWGPEEANKLLAEDGRYWIEPSIDFCRI